jgi:hypothetical protein
LDAPGSVALIVGLLTAAIALLGYWNTQHLQRRDRRGVMYAEAMAAMRAFEQAPYLIRRRADSTGATRAEVAVKLIDANTRVTYSEKLLLMDSQAVGGAYGLLATVTKDQVRVHRAEAWRTPVISHDEQVPDSTMQYPYDNEPEWALCVVAMRRELAPLGWMRRRKTLRECAALAGRRGLSPGTRS